MALVWESREGDRNMAPLSYSGPYVISHRSYHTLSYRPEGQHVPLGQFDTADEAKATAERHAESIARS